MKHAILKLACVAACLLIPVVLVSAEADRVEDHPLISRYAGAEFQESAVTEYDRYVVALAPLARNQLTETLTIEGKITQLQYTVSGRSTLEVLRNYQQGLRNAGFDVLFEHHGENWNSTMYWVQRVYDPHGHYWKSSRRSTFVGNSFHYLAAQLEDPSGDIYVTLYATPTRDATIIQVGVIETVPMDTGMITVDVDYLRSEIERTGTVTLHGLQFFADSAQMTPASVDILEEVAAFLAAHPSMNFYVVGHTTTLGPHQNLMRLSEARAQACVQALVRDHGIAQARLFAAGVGGLAPVASNATAEDRARNRRVELVVR
ncbi:MAG: OmpA family protein [Spirochaetaceae bacterium]|nr:MAG: OmpA family protein [Spirochaetaceae bacterium]